MLVKATDTSMASTTVKVAIDVIDVREAPKIDDEDADATPAENLTATTTVEKNSGDDTDIATTTVLSTYAATDDEDDQGSETTLKWSLEGADKDMFALCDEDDGDVCTNPNGVDSPANLIISLRFKENPDFEARADSGGNNVYNVTVVATDSDRQTASRNVAVTLTNVEENGTVTLDRVQPEVGSAITATLSDPDGGVSGVTWQWQSQETGSRPAPDPDTAWTDIRGATSRAYTPVAEDVSDTGTFLRAFAEYTDNFRRNDDPDTQNIDESQEKDEAVDGISYHVVVGTVDGNRPPAFGDQDLDTPGTQDTQATRRVNENSGHYTTVGMPVKAVDNDPAN